MPNPISDELVLAEIQELASVGFYGGRGFLQPSTAVLGLCAALFLNDLTLWRGASDTLTDDEIDDINEMVAQLELDLMMTGDMYPMDRVKVTNNATVWVNSGVATYLPFNTEEYDPEDMHDNAVNNDRLYAVNDGLHVITANIKLFASAPGTFRLNLIWYDSTVPATHGMQELIITPPAITNFLTLQIADQLYLHEGDYLQVQFHHDSGAPCGVWSFRPAPWFSVVRL